MLILSTQLDPDWILTRQLVTMGLTELSYKINHHRVSPIISHVQFWTSLLLAQVAKWGKNLRVSLICRCLYEIMNTTDIPINLTGTYLLLGLPSKYNNVYLQHTCPLLSILCTYNMYAHWCGTLFNSLVPYGDLLLLWYQNMNALNF